MSTTSKTTISSKKAVKTANDFISKYLTRRSTPADVGTIVTNIYKQAADSAPSESTLRRAVYRMASEGKLQVHTTKTGKKGFVLA